MAKAGLHPDWLVPDWPAPANVRAAFTTRSGGVSQAPFDAMNLGDHVQDSAQNVLANRGILGQAVSAQPVFLQQVHGVDVAALALASVNGPTQIADACVTHQPGIACTVMVADCLPVLFCTADGTVVAAAHAGWRGLCRGVLEQTLDKICRFRHASKGFVASEFIANQVFAWLGPAIGPDAFEVGPDVREAFSQGSNVPSEVDAFFKLTSDVAGGAKGKYLANLSGLARHRLAAAGVVQVFGNDGSAPWCTVNNPTRYYSHRRDAALLGSTGRMAACVWLTHESTSNN
jgi:YfiH family protein